MANAVNSGSQVGYCGNVHPAVTVDQLIANVHRHTVAVKALLNTDGAMPFGIWVSASALRELQSLKHIERLAKELNDAGLIPFTVNGFPFGDFHQSVVKQSVYLPDWTDRSRLDYTLDLANLHHRLLPPDSVSTISTLPLGWPRQRNDPQGTTSVEFMQRCAENLTTCAIELKRRFEQTGRKHLVCIEPEPGCILDCCGDVVDFFDRYFSPRDADTVRNHIGICHDICHSAVMFESQSEAIAAYTQAEIQVGKIQVSSAVEVNFFDVERSEIEEALRKLRALNEPKYLHQTSIEHEDGSRDFYTDLSDALASNPGEGIWRVHFHVPIFLERETTQSCISQCLDAIKANNLEVYHFEIETYAWPVLPDGIFTGSLNEGIAKEIRWFEKLTAGK